MKKVRMTLSAIAVFAVVGSALAFTGKLGTGSLACRETPGTCPSSRDFNLNSTSNNFQFCGNPGTEDCDVAEENAEVSPTIAE